jgi:Tat protein secretion system quality control protein TatD with DNase activity
MVRGYVHEENITDILPQARDLVGLIHCFRASEEQLRSNVDQIILVMSANVTRRKSNQYLADLSGGGG